MLVMASWTVLKVMYAYVQYTYVYTYTWFNVIKVIINLSTKEIT